MDKAHIKQDEIRPMRTIGLLASGGDAPGMNACIRAVVRKALHEGLNVMGIERGYIGLIRGNMIKMERSSVANIIQRGGTILKTARSEEFKTKKGRAIAARMLKEFEVDGLIVIGGNGSFKGAYKLACEQGVAVVGIPGTIDNDVYGSDFSIGFDTAINTALAAIDKIRDTAASHERLFFVEVMGRDSGHIALEVGVAGGAEKILIPEERTDIKLLCEKILKGQSRGKNSSIIVVSEGDDMGSAFEIAEKVKKKTGMEYRVCVLGHVQRGGSPTGRDRVLASKLGALAVQGLIEGRHGTVAGEVKGVPTLTPLSECIFRRRKHDKMLSELADVLA
jgi:6-phosphofructokinase 1